MKKIILMSLIVTGSLMAQTLGNNVQNNFNNCVDKAETKEEFLNCKRNFRNEQNINIEMMKSKILNTIDYKIKKLEESKSCVMKANSREDLKKCRPKKDHYKSEYKKKHKKCDMRNDEHCPMDGRMNMLDDDQRMEMGRMQGISKGMKEGGLIGSERMRENREDY